MGTSAIEWTDATWNPVVGCTRVSEGCRHCYAFSLHDMRHEAFKAGKSVPAQYAKPFKVVQLLPDRLEQPLHWRRPRMVFVNSMSDLFHERVPFEYIARVFCTMMGSPKHTFQILTKRPERAAEFLAACGSWEGYVTHNGAPPSSYGGTGIIVGPSADDRWPLPNVWLGTSVEDQRTADERIPHLLRCPAAVKFLSCEPLLGPIFLRDSCDLFREYQIEQAIAGKRCGQNWPDWVIVGGESGPDARPMHPAWARSIRDQCQAAGVPFFFKQWGEWMPGLPLAGQRCIFVTLDGEQLPEGATFTDEVPDGACCMIREGKRHAGRELDGRVWDEFPPSAPAAGGKAMG